MTSEGRVPSPDDVLDDADLGADAGLPASGRGLPPEVEEALAKARVSMRAKTEQMLADHGLTPEQIVKFMAEIDKAGEELRRKTAPARTLSATDGAT